MIGLLPAAGKAERMHGLPKFLLPIADTYLMKRHVDLMDEVRTHDIHIGVGEEWLDLIWDFVPDEQPYEPINRKTMSETLLSGYREIEGYGWENEPILFGMPDTYIEDERVYHKLAAALTDGADVAVALFIARNGQYHGGMCSTASNQVAEVIDKPGKRIPSAPYIWGAMAWQPGFWDYIKPEHPHIGYALPGAIADGLDVRAVMCEGNYYDCGTPAEYFECIRATTREKVNA